MARSKTIFGEQQPTEIIKKAPDKKPRKKRSDAKHNIKFRLNESEKRRLKFNAKDQGLSLTAFASSIVHQGLQQSETFQESEYDHAGQFVHVMLNKEDSDTIKTLAIELDEPLRRVVHRIIKQHLEPKTSELQINYYRGDHYGIQ